MQIKALTLALVLAAGSLAAVPFEGIVRYKPIGSSPTDNNGVEFSVKGDKFRSDSNTPSHGAIITDTKTKRTILLLPAKKGYVVMQRPVPRPSKHKSPMVKTGKAETIAGHKAEEWAYKGSKDKSALWGTNEVGGWAGLGGSHDPNSGSKIPADFRARGYLPLRFVGEQGSGMEAVLVERKSLPDSLFQVPAGYKAMQLPPQGPHGAGALKANDMTGERHTK